MKNLRELQREIESARLKLDRSFLQKDNNSDYYQRSTEVDMLIEEYLAAKERMERI